MKRYLSIYRCLLQLNYHRMLTHRENFFNGLIASVAWGVFSIVAIYILTSRSSSVFGWSRAELFVLIGVFNILVGSTYRMFFARNFDRFTQVIQRGELDAILLKPYSSQFALSFWYISYHNIVRVILSILYTGIALTAAHVPITAIGILEFCCFSIFGLFILYAVWYMVMTTVMWFPDLYNITELLYSVDSITRYPPQILWAMRFAAFIVFFPLTLTVSIPTKALLHTVTLSDAAIIISFGCGLLAASHWFWKFSLRYYTSASG